MIAVEVIEVAHPRCQQAIASSLQTTFGFHQDLAEIAAFLAPILYGKTSVQVRRTLRHLLKTTPLSQEVAVSARLKFCRAVLRGLRDGRCLAHQTGTLPKVRFGAANLPDAIIGRDGTIKQRPAGVDDATWLAVLQGEGWTGSTTTSAGAFDMSAFQAVFQTVFTGVVGLAAAGIHADTAAKNRDALTAALSAGGASDETIDGLETQLGTASNVIATLQAQVQAGQITPEQFQAAVAAEADRLAAEAQEKEKLSSGAVAGIAIGGVVAVALLGFLVAKAFGNRAVGEPEPRPWTDWGPNRPYPAVDPHPGLGQGRPYAGGPYIGPVQEFLAPTPLPEEEVWEEQGQRASSCGCG